MRFTKAEILESFDRQDRSYRLAILCTHWLQDAAHYQPSAAADARGAQMQARGEWISFKDLADLLKQPESRTVLSSEFILNQLHALIRAPFEIVTDYCEDFEAHHPERGLLTQLKESPWYDVARFIRHAISHNFRFEFTKGDLKRLPATWNGIAITEEL